MPLPDIRSTFSSPRLYRHTSQPHRAKLGLISHTLTSFLPTLLNESCFSHPGCEHQHPAPAELSVHDRMLNLLCALYQSTPPAALRGRRYFYPHSTTRKCPHSEVTQGREAGRNSPGFPPRFTCLWRTKTLNHYFRIFPENLDN